jgi:hypothetical protein
MIIRNLPQNWVIATRLKAMVDIEEFSRMFYLIDLKSLTDHWKIEAAQFICGDDVEGKEEIVAEE